MLSSDGNHLETTPASVWAEQLISFRSGAGGAPKTFGEELLLAWSGRSTTVQVSLPCTACAAYICSSC